MPKSQKRMLKTCLGILILGLLFLFVDVGQLFSNLSGLTPGIIVYLFLISILLIYISALKWQYFIESFKVKVSALKLFNLYLLGYFVNLFAPSYLGGDAVRSWYIGKKVGQHEAFTATILERYTGLVAMVTLALVFVWFVDIVTIELRISIIVIAIGLLVITFMALSPKTFRWVQKIPRLEPVCKSIEKIQAGLNLARKDKALLLKAMALSFLFHVFTVVNVLAAAYAVGWYDPPILDLFIVIPLILLVGSLPIAPGGLGIQEGAFMFFLSGIGATPEQALALAVVLRAKHAILSLTGGLVLLRMRADSRTFMEENTATNGVSKVGL